MTVVKESRTLYRCVPTATRRWTRVKARVVRTKGKSSPEFRFGKRYIYACPACHRALGISHREGFWAG